MNLSHLAARQSIWAAIQAAALEQYGFGSKLFGAAVKARVGRDLEGAEFAALAARLPVEERLCLLASIEKRAT